MTQNDVAAAVRALKTLSIFRLSGIVCYATIVLTAILLWMVATGKL